MILSRKSPASAAVATPSSTTQLHTRSDAFARGAVVLLPALDSSWVEGRGRPLILIVGLAAVALLALLVAAAAHLNSQRHRTRSAVDDEELFTTTPLPMSKDELARLRRHPPHHAFSGLKLPRWLQVGSLLAALAITWVVAQRIRPTDGPDARTDVERSPIRVGAADRPRDEASDSPEDLDLAPDSAPSFAFQVREWVASGGGCAGFLEVTKGEPRGWDLTARVHDGQGQLIDTSRARVASLREGDVVEFKFPKAECDRIGAWDVRGGRRE
jgi:hypothetical protein